jgi:hypothetical protein
MPTTTNNTTNDTITVNGRTLYSTGYSVEADSYSPSTVLGKVQAALDNLDKRNTLNGLTGDTQYDGRFTVIDRIDILAERFKVTKGNQKYGETTEGIVIRNTVGVRDNRVGRNFTKDLDEMHIWIESGCSRKDRWSCTSRMSFDAVHFNSMENNVAKPLGCDTDYTIDKHNTVKMNGKVYGDRVVSRNKDNRFRICVSRRNQWDKRASEAGLKVEIKSHKDIKSAVATIIDHFTNTPASQHFVPLTASCVYMDKIMEAVEDMKQATVSLDQTRDGIGEWQTQFDALLTVLNNHGPALDGIDLSDYDSEFDGFWAFDGFCVQVAVRGNTKKSVQAAFGSISVGSLNTMDCPEDIIAFTKKVEAVLAC